MARNGDRQNHELTQDHVMIGEVVKPHGIRGEVKVYSYSERPENFKQYTKIVLQQPAGNGRRLYKIVKSRPHGKLAILQLEGVATREAAEALQGSTVWLEKDDFPELAGDEYYWHQLEGRMVVTESGRELGRVSKLFSTPAHDIMVVTGAGHEYLIPVKGEIIRQVDQEAGKIIISAPAGLLDINR